MTYTSWSVVFGEQPSAAKWNILGTNDAFFDSKIGSGSAWTSFTPSWANLTVGNGTNTGLYQQLGKMVFVKTDLILGSGSSMGSIPTLTLPITATSTGIGSLINTVIGSSSCFDNSGSAFYQGIAIMNNTTTVKLYVLGVGGALIGATGISSTSPMTWAISDQITSYFFYEGA